MLWIKNNELVYHTIYFFVSRQPPLYTCYNRRELSVSVALWCRWRGEGASPRSSWRPRKKRYWSSASSHSRSTDSTRPSWLRRPKSCIHWSTDSRARNTTWRRGSSLNRSTYATWCLATKCMHSLLTTLVKYHRLLAVSQRFVGRRTCDSADTPPWWLRTDGP